MRGLANAVALLQISFLTGAHGCSSHQVSQVASELSRSASVVASPRASLMFLLPTE